MNKIKLGVNIDHIAFIKKSRDTNYPDLREAVSICESSGADSITIHLREDRRHIQDEDAILIRKYAKKLNFEMANTSEMVNFAVDLKPDFCCIVPEKRDERTTEGGLTLCTMSDSQKNNLANNIKILKDKNIEVSLFIDPVKDEIKIAKNVGAQSIELHTGTYANSKNNQVNFEIDKLKIASNYAHSLSLKVNAGHGLHYSNTSAICKIKYISELNIGHSIIAESIFLGLSDAIKKMKGIINNCD
tara:strand:- start:464 stop:1198 length:735 start_codon:yes stop_codon:yes gene_type:complete